MNNFIKTKDGSFTLYSSKYDECYHSLKAGAFSETLHKHIIPAIDYVLESNPSLISILDICFGLGYNTLCTLYYLDKKGYLGDIEIYSAELDSHLIRSLNLLPYPTELLAYLPILQQISKTFTFNNEYINVTVLISDAKEIVADTEKKFDIVYQDAFSRKNNPELWDEEYFKNIYLLLNEKGIMTTYTRSKGIRKIMTKCGFKVYEHDFDKDFTVRSGTLAVKNDKINHKEV